MADVKWIKITTDIFDDEKIILIESLPDAYAIITVWFKLLCLAGKQNNSGVFLLGRMPYTDKMLATIFRMKESTVTMALQTFEQFGMVQIIDGVITIPNWGKHQNLDQLESKKEYMRGYMREYRAKQKALTSGKEPSKTNSKAKVSQADKERDKEKETDIEIKKESKRGHNLTLFESLYSEFILSDTLIEKAREWVIYKDERKEEYVEKGLRSLLRKIENKYLALHKNDKPICDLIDECMSNQWKGIIFERLKEPAESEKSVQQGKQGTFDTDEFYEAALRKACGDDLYEEVYGKPKPKTAAEDPEIRAKADALKGTLQNG